MWLSRSNLVILSTLPILHRLILAQECQPLDENPFGKCQGCPNQVFISSDCTKAFECGVSMDSASVPLDFFAVSRGCLYECNGENQLIWPDFQTGTFECVDNSDGARKCPREFDMRCQYDRIPYPLDPKQCQCDGQIWVHPLCSEGLKCDSSLPLDQQLIVCKGGQVVQVDWTSLTLSCVPESEGNCPGKGGFSFGSCSGQSTTTVSSSSTPITTTASGSLSTATISSTSTTTAWLPSSLSSTYVSTSTIHTISTTTISETAPVGVKGNNPFGECDGCNGQVFVGNDCSQAFECRKGPFFPEDNDGLLYACDLDQFVQVDFENGLYDCADKTSVSAECPGDFYVHCLSDPIPTPLEPSQCQCNGEIWVNYDCSEGLKCDSNSPLGGDLLLCPSGKTVQVDMSVGSLSCLEDNFQCPRGGGYYLGPCLDKGASSSTSTTVTTSTSTITTTTKTTSTTSYAYNGGKSANLDSVTFTVVTFLALIVL
jgi:hypothetical protein